MRIIDENGANINNILTFKKAILIFKGAYNFRKGVINYQKERFKCYQFLTLFSLRSFLCDLCALSLRTNRNYFNLNNYFITSIIYIKKITLYKRNNFYN